MHTKTARALRAQYRWAYATSTLLPLQEIGQNQHEKGGWAYNTSWAYNTYSTVYECMIDQEAFVWCMCTPCTNGLGEQYLCKVMYKRLGVQLELDD